MPEALNEALDLPVLALSSLKTSFTSGEDAAQPQDG
jgi:hypothetical protein